ncbi:hypothetical protein DK26_01175 [Bosea sp. WAO]|nr:hypothetical protein DK26_01175 [Bosea sp. WAO]
MARQLAKRQYATEAEMPRYGEIRTAEERKTAVSLIQHLSGAPEDCADEVRLDMLATAVETWDVKRAQQRKAG